MLMESEWTEKDRNVGVVVDTSMKILIQYRTVVKKGKRRTGDYKERDQEQKSQIL